MKTCNGHSSAHDAAQAVDEATRGWPQHPSVVFAFCSTAQDADEVVSALRQRFASARIVGCTTSGEHLDGDHYRQSLVLTGLYDSDIAWSSAAVTDLASFDGQRAEQLVGGLFAEFGTTPDDIDPEDYFALLFVDGLSLQEEGVAALIDGALCGVRLAGGSAGDDLAFEQTHILHTDGAFSDGFVLVIGQKNGVPVEILKHQHFVPTDNDLVITRADPATRRVYEIDGYPALTAYAAALGLQAEELTSDIAFVNPVTLSYQGELYVRSVQQLHDDGSISFYCAIEEGMVLQIGGHEDMAEALGNDLAHLNRRMNGIHFILGFNCILRAIEADGGEQHAALGRVVKQHCTNMVGFDTYGEQLDGLHMNQTLVAVAVGSAA